jgi:hypothetical protein
MNASRGSLRVVKEGHLILILKEIIPIFDKTLF